MKSILVIVTLLLCNSSTYRIVEGANSENIVSSKLQQRSNLTLINLNFDVLFQMFSFVDFNDMLSLIEAVPTISPIITQILATKYNNFEWKIELNETVRVKIREYSEEKCFRIMNFKDVVFYLKHFGSAIKKLSINDKLIGESESIILSQLINEYGCRQLTHLNLGELREDTLQQFAEPFENVEVLAFQMEREIKNGILPLNQLFPQLKQLEINIFPDVDCNFFDIELPNLQYITIIDNTPRSYLLDSVALSTIMTGFLSKNTRIQSANLTVKSWQYIKAINELLPNIENLTLKMFESQSGKVHMENVKNLDLNSYYYFPIDKFTFPRLESIKINFMIEFFSMWCEFLAAHENLAKLDLIVISQMELVNFTMKSHNLVEVNVTIEKYEPDRVDSVIEFIEQHEKLMKLNLVADQRFEKDKEQIRERFEEEWYIQNYDRNEEWTGLTFERKT